MRDSIAVAMKKRRNAMKISQRELVEMSGLSRGMVSLYETDRKLPKIDDLEKMCKAFNCTATELLGF